MNIALISEHASPLGTLGGVDSGGQNVYVAQIAKRLASMGHRVDVFTRKDSPDLPSITDWEYGARVIHVPAGPPRFVPKEELFPFMDEFTAYFLRSAWRRTYDVVHANFWMSGMVAAEAKRRIGVPFVITFHALGRVWLAHQQEADRFPPIRLEIEERLANQADCVIAECPQDEEDLLRYCHADPARIRVVPCGFDRAELWPIPQDAARRALGLDPADRVILQLGRMVPRKGVDVAVRALGILARRGVEAKLLIVGGEIDAPDPAATPEIGRLQAIAREEGILDRITFAGRQRRDALKWYYGAADVFVTTPWYEPFGMTPIESMACGTPVIGARVGGIGFTVKDGVTGYLVPPKNPEAVAEKLEYLFLNPHVLERMRHAALVRVNRRFTWRKVLLALSSIYEDVIADRAAVANLGLGGAVYPWTEAP